MLKYAIVGFGGLGKVHFSGYEQIKNQVDVELVAFCDVEESAFASKTATNLGADNSGEVKGNIYYSIEDLLANEQLDFIVSAVPTYLHEEIAVKAMEKGVHVFSEKPMSLTLEACENMIAKAKEKNLKLMVGQCLRFWPEYVKARDIVKSGEYGKVVRADFQRISCTPKWGWQNWFMDTEKSGGAALDLHVHDVDFINFAFGMPNSVTSVATNYVTKYDSMTTTYRYDDFVVTATGEWGCHDNYPFSVGYFIRMEKATLEFKNGKVALYKEDGTKEDVAVEASSAYVNEVVEFARNIINDEVSKINPPEESRNSIRLALAEIESADKGETVKL